MTAPADRVAGWYGKIPALGDFASRRLSQRFVNAWDAWLQRGLAASRATLQEQWLEVYLNGPIWNFALLPGVCDENAWIGTLMPSVDKVGRHFPLTIALEIEPHPEIMATLIAEREWFAAIDLIALGCLDINCTPEHLEVRLAELPFPPYPVSELEGVANRMLDTWWAASSGASLALQLPASESMADVFNAAALNQFARNKDGKSIWWSDTTSTASTQLLAFHGLPSEYEFAMLLDVPDQLPV